MTSPKFTRSDDAKKAGWFSRRHQTREAHDAAFAAWRREHPHRRVSKGGVR